VVATHNMTSIKPNGFFLTGTDTGVGKTQISVSLVEALVKHGLRVSVMKPIASGSEHTSEGLRNSDAVALAAVSNVAAPYRIINPYCFKPAISPHIAAEEARIAVKLSVIESCFATLAGSGDCVIVEGAGGWYAPINSTESMADLQKLLRLPVLLVVGMRLGCLNHALLTQAAIEASGASYAGWVANAMDPSFERAAENLSSLERILGSEPLAVFPFVPGSRADVRGGERLARALSLISL
jgi:dethiobiotin synthetase